MNEKIFLWSDTAQDAPSVTPYLLKDDEPHPAILVVPGGGYHCVCKDTEGGPIAVRFNELGYHAFVLEYRVAPHHFPEPQQDAIRAMRLIRHNAEKWHVIPNRIAACGFSAGAHLAGCLGTITADIPDVMHDEIDAERGDADAMILSYGVLCFTPWTHQGSIVGLLGQDHTPEMADRCSLEKRVGEHTPPAFVWCTVADTTVPFRNSVEFVQAMAAHARPCEFHLFPYGEHGMLLGLGTTDISTWQIMSSNFLKLQWDLRDGDPQKLLYKYHNQAQWREEILFMRSKGLSIRE